MEEGRFVRVSGTRQGHDSIETMGRKAKRDVDNKQRRRRGNKSEKRWQKWRATRDLEERAAI